MQAFQARGPAEPQQLAVQLQSRRERCHQDRPDGQRPVRVPQAPVGKKVVHGLTTAIPALRSDSGLREARDRNSPVDGIQPSGPSAAGAGALDVRSRERRKTSA
ncbi:hypothetical protein GCM10009605_29170 [Nocardiopsis composta]